MNVLFEPTGTPASRKEGSLVVERLEAKSETITARNLTRSGVESVLPGRRGHTIAIAGHAVIAEAAAGVIGITITTDHNSINNDTILVTTTERENLLTDSGKKTDHHASASLAAIAGPLIEINVMDSLFEKIDTVNGIGKTTSAIEETLTTAETDDRSPATTTTAEAPRQKIPLDEISHSMLTPRGTRETGTKDKIPYQTPSVQSTTEKYNLILWHTPSLSSGIPYLAFLVSITVSQASEQVDFQLDIPGGSAAESVFFQIRHPNLLGGNSSAQDAVRYRPAIGAPLDSPPSPARILLPPDPFKARQFRFSDRPLEMAHLQVVVAPEDSSFDLIPLTVYQGATFDQLKQAVTHVVRFQRARADLSDFSAQRR